MRPLVIIGFGVVSFALSGCDVGPKSARGFRLPDGDAARGEKLFSDMGCPACHDVAGRPGLREGVDAQMTVVIGGPTPRIRNYGELVTSVINPSHEIARGYERNTVSTDGESLMRNYNDVMTVSEMIDIVAFIQRQYQLDDEA